MLKLLAVLALAVTAVSSQTWVSRAWLEDHETYWMSVMQGLIEELERRHWCNLKLVDITQTINDNLFDLRLVGNVSYTNGFVVSIQKIDVTRIERRVASSTVDGEVVPTGSVTSRLNFRNLKIGYDVEAELQNFGYYRTTLTGEHILLEIELAITQNLITKELTTRSTVTSTSAISNMAYMPENKIAEGLRRRFSHNTMASATTWAREIMEPIILDIAKKIGFPSVCFNNCN